MKALVKQILDLLMLLGLVILLLAAGRAFFLFIHYDSFLSFTPSDLFSVFYKGLLYDFEVTIALNMPFVLLFLWPSKIYNSIFYQATLKLLFFVVNLGALFVNLLDIKAFNWVAHRLRAYEFRHELTVFYNELKGLKLTEFISGYLSLSVFFLAFALILWFSLRYIKRHKAEETKNLQTVRRIISFLVLSVFAGLFYNNYFNKSDWLSGLYSRADRKLVPVIMNNPYLLLRSINCNELSSSGDDWDFGAYESEKQYAALNTEIPECVKMVILDNVGNGFTYPDSIFSGKDFKNKAFSGLWGNYESIFKTLDETLLSFPTVFGYYFYQSIYSLNRFENLVGLLQNSGYSVGISSYGYENRIVQIISHFYGFEKLKDSADLSAKNFELILVNGNNSPTASVEKLLGNLAADIDGKKALIIAINNSVKHSANNIGLNPNLKIYASFSLPADIYVNNGIVQLLDIKPTILHLINYREPFISYGSSWFANDEKVILQSEFVDSFKLLKDSVLLVNSNNETISLKLLKNSSFSVEDYKDSLAVERIVLENKLHSILDDYKKRLINNELR